jgi:N-acetylglucosamine kinase-like BadF-type ATPase
MSRLLLGVDGGATKTVALVADGSGKVLGAGRSGSSDIHNEVTPEVAVEHVVESVRVACAEAGVEAGDLGACVFGLCGADWPEDSVFYVGALQERLGLAAPPTVTNDAFNSLRAGTEDGVGIALVLGTGAALAARGPAGAEWFSGERMERIGALELGREAYDLLVRGEYGDGPRPRFEEAALRVFDADSVEAMVHAITGTGGHGYRSVARLAPVVLDAGHAGDPEAGDLIREQARRVAGYVRRGGDLVGLAVTGRTLVLAGGLTRHHGSDLRDALVEALPGYGVTRARLEPAHGAVLMAGDLVQLAVDVDRLVASGPDGEYFDTEGGGWIRAQRE